MQFSQQMHLGSGPMLDRFFPSVVVQYLTARRAIKLLVNAPAKEPATDRDGKSLWMEEAGRRSRGGRKDPSLRPQAAFCMRL